MFAASGPQSGDINKIQKIPATKPTEGCYSVYCKD
jgi:hypothetical protein